MPLSCALLAIVSVAGTHAAEPQPGLEAAAPELPELTAASMAEALGRGVNFGGTLEAPQEGAWGITLNERMFEAVREGGFQTIRLPVRFSNHAAAVAPYTLDESFLQRVDFAIAEALEQGLNIIVDVHHYHELDGDPVEPGEQATGLSEAEQRERFLAIWEQVARRYQSYPNDKLLFELYNEPHGRTEPMWNALVAEALEVVRQTNPDRIVIVSALEWGTAWGLDRLELPDDDRLIVTIHNYAPFQFTMQGASWIEGSEAWRGTSCCSQTQIDEMTVPLDMAAQWSEATGRPIFVGEFGANSQAPYDARVTYTRISRELTEARGFSWAYWDFASEEFGPYDPATDSWRTELHHALAPAD